MKNRLCIDEKLLAIYLCGLASEKEKEYIETHIADCDECLSLLCETDSLIKRNLFFNIASRLAHLITSNIYTVLTVCTLLMSFIVHKYFLQFLLASALFGIKSIIDSKTTKMLIMIKESLKNENKDIEKVFKQ
jgi:hypothetical protein